MTRRTLAVPAAAIGTCLAAAQAHPPQAVPPDGGRDVAVPFHPSRLLLSEKDTAAGVTVYEFTVPPLSAGAPPHRHSSEDEFAYVLSGELTLLLAEEVVIAPPGTMAALTRGHVHAFWNAGDEPARALFFVAGEGRFEAFFDAVAVAAREHGTEDPAAMGPLIGALAAEHGIEIEMDALPQSARAYYPLP